jgi:hypothetical protein
MLLWHRKLWLIDHGAALYFHHAWARGDDPSVNPFSRIKDHVLLRLAAQLEQTDARMRQLLTEDKIAVVIDLIPDSWLSNDPGFSKLQQRAAYVEFFTKRLRGSRVFLDEALRARA